MRIAVAGDTHGRTESIRKALSHIRFDSLFFTGDYYRDGKKLASQIKVKYYGVVGNCDLSMGKTELMVKLDGCSFYITHGHRYGVKKSINSLFYRGKEMGADAVIFGHTHVPFIERIDDMWLINPGSPSLPRSNSRCTYAVIETDNGSLKPRIIEL
ncbi:MAG: metallophosphoesterase family protein [Syntrophomonadaceae bacterium]